MILHRFDRGTLRAAGFVALLTVVFLVTNTAVAAAADGTAGGGGLLAPLNIRTAEGNLLDGYQLEAHAGSDFNVVGQAQVLMMSGLFTLGRLLVGLCCWLIGFVFRFPLLTLLTGPAQHLADSYQTHIVDALGLKGLMLSWGFRGLAKTTVQKKAQTVAGRRAHCHLCTGSATHTSSTNCTPRPDAKQRSQEPAPRPRPPLPFEGKGT